MTSAAPEAPGGFLDVIMGHACNVECDYCTITREMRRDSLSTTDIARHLHRGRSDGLDVVSFGGGEPTIRRDLVPLVRLARELGYRTIKIQSNGLMYAYEDFALSLLDAGANQFNISVMGRDREMYRGIMDRPDAFDLVVAGLGHLVRSDARVVADVIMKRDTITRLADTVSCFADLGVEHFVLWLVSLTDRNAANVDSLVPISEMRPYVYEAFEVGRRRSIRVVSRHIPPCMLRDRTDHVWNVNLDRFLIVTPGGTFWLSESRITANTFVAACEGCGARGRCMGVRRDYLDRFGAGEVRPFAGPVALAQDADG